MIKTLQTWFETNLFASADGPSRRPQLSAKFESNIPGLFVVGDLAGAPVIKLAMEQGYNVIEHIASLPRPAVNEITSASASDEDVNDDGLKDVVCHFNTQDAGFEIGDTGGTLMGQTTGGTSIEGSDTVKIVGK